MLVYLLFLILMVLSCVHVFKWQFWSIKWLTFLFTFVWFVMCILAFACFQTFSMVIFQLVMRLLERIVFFAVLFSFVPGFFFIFFSQLLLLIMLRFNVFEQKLPRCSDFFFRASRIPNSLIFNTLNICCGNLHFAIAILYPNNDKYIEMNEIRIVFWIQIFSTWKIPLNLVHGLNGRGLLNIYALGTRKTRAKQWKERKKYTVKLKRNSFGLFAFIINYLMCISHWILTVMILIGNAYYYIANSEINRRARKKLQLLQLVNFLLCLFSFIKRC